MTLPKPEKIALHLKNKIGFSTLWQSLISDSITVFVAITFHLSNVIITVEINTSLWSTKSAILAVIHFCIYSWTHLILFHTSQHDSAVTLKSLHTYRETLLKRNSVGVLEHFRYLLLVMPKSARDKHSANYDLRLGKEITDHTEV